LSKTGTGSEEQDSLTTNANANASPMGSRRGRTCLQNPTQAESRLQVFADESQMRGARGEEVLKERFPMLPCADACWRWSVCCHISERI
jgi:hypothetical protein